MGILFADNFHDEFGTWPLAYIPYGGADFGEVHAIAQAVGEGDDSAFYNAWMSAADRLTAEAETSSNHFNARKRFCASPSPRAPAIIVK
jgi:hypothetical protein